MTASQKLILVINGGSSSVKLSLFEISQDNDPLTWTSNLNSNLLDAKNDEIKTLISSALEKEQISPDSIVCVGHRIVHGGAKLQESVEISDKVEQEIDSLTELAPVHNPIGLKLVQQSRSLFPRARQIAVFDTAFHKNMKKHAYVYPVPYAWYEDFGIRRFGFHGINHQYCSEASLTYKKEAEKIVIAHLGNGCSLSAVNEGKSEDTSMGFTPNEGLMMGARSGSIDAGIIFYLLQEKNFSAPDLENQLNNQSGLSGVSGIGKDMREIEAAMNKGDERAKLAFDIFVHRVKSGIASMAASINGIDTLIFTAGIGEHSSAVRLAVCQGLSFLDLALNSAANQNCTTDGIISTADSKVTVMRITAREDLQIYRECLGLVQ